MGLILVLGAALLAYIGWKSSAPIRAGGWRVGAGLAAAVLVVIGIAVAVRGDEWVGLPLIVLGLLMAMTGRIQRIGRGAAANANTDDMSLSEARSILGVGEGASVQEIKAAYSRLMKLNHPDQGGTTGLAVKLNAARARLLKG